VPTSPANGNGPHGQFTKLAKCGFASLATVGTILNHEDFAPSRGDLADKPWHMIPFCKFLKNLLKRTGLITSQVKDAIIDFNESDCPEKMGC
jgi:hypothetical protein